MSYDESRPTYLQVADEIRHEIVAGRLGLGERLPSVRDLSTRFEIAAVTAQSALRVLRDEGYIASRSTRGYFVRDALPESSTPPPSPEFSVIREQLDAISATVGDLAGRVSELETAVQAADGSVRRPPSDPQLDE